MNEMLLYILGVLLGILAMLAAILWELRDISELLAR